MSKTNRSTAKQESNRSSWYYRVRYPTQLSHARRQTDHKTKLPVEQMQQFLLMSLTHMTKRMGTRLSKEQQR